MPLETPKSGFGSAKKHKKQKAVQTERDLAETLGGVAQPGSGAGLRHKGDVKTTKALIDSKETEGNSIVVTSTMLAQIHLHATRERKHPALCLKFGQMTSGIGTPRQWVVIPLDVYAQLTEDNNVELT